MSNHQNSKAKNKALLDGYYYPQGRKGRFWPKSVIKRPNMKYIYGKGRK